MIDNSASLIRLASYPIVKLEFHIVLLAFERTRKLDLERAD